MYSSVKPCLNCSFGSVGVGFECFSLDFDRLEYIPLDRFSLSFGRLCGSVVDGACESFLLWDESWNCFNRSIDCVLIQVMFGCRFVRPDFLPASSEMNSDFFFIRIINFLDIFLTPVITILNDIR